MKAVARDVGEVFGCNIEPRSRRYHRARCPRDSVHARMVGGVYGRIVNAVWQLCGRARASRSSCSSAAACAPHPSAQEQIDAKETAALAPLKAGLSRHRGRVQHEGHAHSTSRSTRTATSRPATRRRHGSRRARHATGSQLGRRRIRISMRCSPCGWWISWAARG